MASGGVLYLRFPALIWDVRCCKRTKTARSALTDEETKKECRPGARDTPWKINMEHNNGGLEDDFPF